ncbi:MAG: helix-turn-helix domain-containing protein [Polyangiaceae bacterium]
MTERGAQNQSSEAAQDGSAVEDEAPSSSLNTRRSARRIHVQLEQSEREAILRILSESELSPGHARRLRVVLLSADDVSGIEIARRLELSVGQVSRIRARFVRGGVTGLADAPHPGRHDHGVSAELMAHVRALAETPPPPGRSRWSSRLIAARVGLSSATVAKILRGARGA